MDSLYLAKRAVQRKRYGKRIAEARQRRHQFIPVQSVADEMNIKKTKLLKKPGKFRVKTIDLKNNLLAELKKALN